MRILNLSQNFVSSWLSGTALFLIIFSLWWAHDIGRDTPIMLGWLGGMVMMLLYVENEGKATDLSRCMLWPCLVTLTCIAVNMALASLGVCADVFGLLN